MANYQTRVTDIIGGIKQRLGEYEYRGGDTLLRELVQNADDAKASSLTFLLTDGVSGAATSLLRGPALVAINDGAFRRKDEHAMTSVSASSKAADDAAVGRFGIGQKSVFHVCEAFCFVGSSELDGEIGDIVNPWFDTAKDAQGVVKGDEAHPDWSSLTPDDLKRMRESIQELLPSQFKNWFVLWLPLRLDGHGHGKDGRVVLSQQRVPALRADLRRALASEELALLRPQLKHVRLIQTYERTDSQLEQLGRVEADREVGLRPVEGNQLRSINASMLSGWGTSATEYTVALREWSAADGDLSTLKQAADWPQAVYFEEDTFNQQSGPEKAMAHGCVAVVRRPVGPNERSQLQIRWAVFLPVLDGGTGETLAGGRWRWWITLHGYWFLDHARRRIPFAPPSGVDARSDGEVRRDWNVGLRDRVTLPLLLPALAAAVQDLDAADVTPLINALPRLLGEQPRHAWTAGKMLVLRAFDSRWQLVEDGPDTRVLAIPRLTLDVASRVRSAFAALRDVVVVFDDALPLRYDPPSQWAEADIESVLVAIANTALDRDLIEFLTRWLGPCPHRGSTINRFLWAAAAVGGLPGPQSGDLRTWKALAALVDHGTVVSVDVTVARLTKAAQAVTAPVGVILHRHLFDPADPSLAVRLAGHFVPLLRWLAKQDDYADVCREITARIGISKLLAQSSLEDVQFLVLRQAGDDKLVWRSPREARSLADEGMLLAPVGAFAVEVLIRDFARAIDGPGAAILVVPSRDRNDINTWLSVFQLGDGSPGNLARLLLKHPLAAPRARLPLLEGLLGAGTKENTRLATRYLLHGEHSRVTDKRALWIPSRTLDDATRKLLENTDERWRLVPPDMVDKLTPAQRQELNIQELEDSAVMSLIGSVGDDELRDAFRDLSDADRRRFFLATHDNDTAARLAFHEPLSGGDPVAASSPGVFWCESFQVHPSLAEIVVVRLDSDPRASARQKELIRKWTPDKQVEEALERGAHEAMLDALGKGAPVDRRVLERRWLALRDGSMVSPDQITVASDMSALREVLPLVPDAGVHQEEEVSASVREHEGWEKVRAELARDPRRAFERVFEWVLRACPPGWALAETKENCRNLIGTLLTAPKDLVGLHRELRLGLEASLHLDHDVVAAAMCGPVSSDTWLSRLNTFATDSTWTAFKVLLDLASANENDFVRNLLPKLTLRCADGSWRPAEAIARAGDELEDEFRLHDDIEHLVLLPFDTTAPVSAPASLETQSVEEVELYLQGWIERGLSPQQAAAFVSLFSQGDVWDVLVEKWKPRGLTPAEFRHRIFDTAPVSQTRKSTLGAPSPEECFEGTKHGIHTTTRVEFVQPGGEQAHISLAGTHLTVRVRSVARGEDSIVVGGRGTALQGGLRVLKLLRVEHASVGDCANALLGGVRTQLRDHHEREIKESALGLFWRGLSDDEARNRFSIARRMVESDLQSTLKRIGVHGVPELRKLQELLASNKERTSRLLEENSDDRQELERLAKEDADLCRRLVDEIGGSSATAAAVLGRVRADLARHQYRQEQVLWELLQNADDAVVQMHGGGSTDARRVVIDVMARGTTLTVRHYGRLINQSRPGADCDGDRLDLYNMLTLNMSEKEAQLGVTGKFGLGFKSIHLITSTPKVSSGALSFQIVGGVLPVAVAMHGTLDTQATNFEIPLDPDVKSDVVLAGVPLLGWFPLFAAGIREIDYSNGAVSTRRSWTGQSGCVSDGGTVTRHLVSSGELGEATTLERAENARRYVVVLPQSSLPSDTPSIWVTAPVLAETWRIPYLLGAPFDLDVGRTQLAPRSSQNHAAFRVLGEMLSSHAREESSSGHLDRAARVKRLWERLLSNEVVAVLKGHDLKAELLKLLHSDGRGASCLAREALPTGLPGEWDVVTSRDRIAAHVPRDSERAIIEFLNVLRSELPDHLELPATGELISEGVNDRLQLVGEHGVAPLGMSHLLDKTDELLRKVDASRTGIVCSLAKLTPLRIEDGEARSRWLHSRQFPSSGGQWTFAKSLLVAKLPDEIPDNARSADLSDEVLRAAFAPREFVLTPDFCARPHFVAFWACRMRLEIGAASQLAEWARGLRDGERERCRSVMRYLVRGALRAELMAQLKSDLPKWIPTDIELRSRPVHWLLEGLTEPECASLVTGLYPPSWSDLLTYDLLDFPELPPRNPGVELRKVLAAWRKDRDSVLARHDADTFGRNLRLSFENPDAESWLALFTRASLYRMGGLSVEQHRGFMELCWKQGWFTLFVGAKRDTAISEVIRYLLRESVRTAPLYFHWVGALIYSYWFASDLDGYLGLLEKLDGEKGDPRPSLTPRDADGLSGGAYDLPPMTVLRWGLPFVIRELRRHNVLKNSRWDPYCFATNRALQQACERVGLNSRGDSATALASSWQLHAEIRIHLSDSDASFDGGYDLALLNYNKGINPSQDYDGEY